MSAPPLRKEIATDSKSYAAASAPTESQQEQERESQHNGDKDREHGKEEAKDTHIEPPAAAESPPVSHDVKVPEPGFDAPEDKMQGGRAAFLSCQSSVCLHGNCSIVLRQQCLHSAPPCMLLNMP